MTCLLDGINKLVVEADESSGQCSFCTISQWGSQAEQDSFGTRKGKLSNKGYHWGGRKEVLVEDSRWKMTKEDVPPSRQKGCVCAVILSAS